MPQIKESTTINRQACPDSVMLLSNTNFQLFIKACMASVIDFYADWCIPCRIMEPILSKLAQVFAGKVFFGRIDVDEYPEIAAEYDVMSIPTSILFKNGEEAYRIIGAVDFNTMRRYVEIYLDVKP
ncbi:MAG: thioredoxin family protein [Vulcanisaeta sp. AZ3]